MQPQAFDDQIENLTAWWRDFCSHPELNFDVHRTVALVEKRLRAMGGEDFSFMLEKGPGAFMWIGNGDSADLHNPTFDLNDQSTPYDRAYFVSLVESYLT